MFTNHARKKMACPLNPKDSIGATKLPVGLVPDVVVAEISTAFLEGSLKYGRYNWRKAGVRSSIYHDALKRHIMKWWNGEERDAKTHVRHLANAGACIAILLDAELQGKLTDDRPPSQPGLSERIDGYVDLIKHLHELFKDFNPKQYTIEDDEPPAFELPKGPPKFVTRVIRTDEPVVVPEYLISTADNRGRDIPDSTNGYVVGDSHPGSISPIAKEDNKPKVGW